MNVNVSIGGVATSARVRSLPLVRQAIAKREQQLNEARAAGTPTNSTRPPSVPPPSARG
jgi:hypothetical protein